MPSTHLSLHYHIIFTTKGRRRMIADTWRDNLHAYIGGIIKDSGVLKLQRISSDRSGMRLCYK